MTLKENSNGNCFAAWLCEYKTRLEQVCVRPGIANDPESVDASNDSERRQEPNDKAASPPALAGEIYFLPQQPVSIAVNR